jgi:DNA-binding MurR/RpiR family transcriptional regulator
MSLDDVMKAATSTDPSSRVAQQVARVVLQQPERSSYASSRELAEIAGVDVSSVTRAAQALGFTGWPELREALRARYLRSLSQAEAGEEAGDEAGDATEPRAASRSLDADRRALSLLRPDLESIARITRVVGRAETRVALGALASLFAERAGALGYRTAIPGDGGELAHTIGGLVPGDVVVVFEFRRLADAALRAAARSRESGAVVCAITDTPGSPLTAMADEVLHVPSEGADGLPTLIGGVAVVNAICTELGDLDPAHSARSLAAVEATWAALGNGRDPDFKSS